jgi:hypothetical protein
MVFFHLGEDDAADFPIIKIRIMVEGEAVS